VKPLVSLLKYALRLSITTEGLGPDPLSFRGLRERYYCSNAHYSLHRALSMSQTQTRKQKILGDVKRKRRQRALTTFTIAIILVAIIVAAVVFLRPPPNAVPLPDYLSHCVTGSLFYHSHPSVTVTVNGVGVPFPVTFDSGCNQPIHTHTIDGVLHVETDQNRDYTLGDWFLLWGHSENSATRAILNSSQIFGFKTDATHHLTMTVNGQNYTQTAPQDYVFLRNAVTGANQCSPTPPSCVPDSIVLTYGP
jgi:hypothetical protein